MALSSEALRELSYACTQKPYLPWALNIMINVLLQDLPCWRYHRNNLRVLSCTTGCGDMRYVTSLTQPYIAQRMVNRVGKPFVSLEPQNGVSAVTLQSLPELQGPITRVGTGDILVLTDEAADKAAVELATGDCPCIIASDNEGRIGIAHCTYKNVCLGIVEKFLNTFIRAGATLDKLSFVMTVGVHDIEVFQEVYNQYQGVLGEDRDEFFTPTGNSTNPYTFNLYEAVWTCLLKAGVYKEQIDGCVLNTREFPHLFNSNRYSPEALRRERCGQIGWLR